MLWLLPAAQLAQLEAPEAAAKVPVLQLVQLAAVAMLKVPGKQSEHSLLPTELLFPAIQVKQAEAPLAL